MQHVPTKHEKTANTSKLTDSENYKETFSMHSTLDASVPCQWEDERPKFYKVVPKRDDEEPVSLENSCTVGICAMEKKVYSAAMQRILHWLMVHSGGVLRIAIFSSETIIDANVEDWPIVDVLISFYSIGLPLKKVIKYAELRKPQCVNDVVFQRLLLDRRLTFSVLKNANVPLVPHFFVNRDTDGEKEELLNCLSQVDWQKSALEETIQSLQDSTNFYQSGDTIYLGSFSMQMPFVEKPACSDRHDIYIYYPSSMGGGIRRLFRKTTSRSSEYYIPAEHEKCGDAAQVRKDGSYVYEKYFETESQQDVKVYCVGPYYAYGELRKSPVVDGIVERLPNGQEKRVATTLSPKETKMAQTVVSSFRQFVCGFDLLRHRNHAYVIDVNGWSFVKVMKNIIEKLANIWPNKYYFYGNNDHLVIREIEVDSYLFRIHNKLDHFW
eukprot:jgi/Galph1/3017/GphlegSOOS_G1669.1